MALPVGHASAGLAAAAIVARVTGTEPGLVLWAGAIVASGAPDLDFVMLAMGRKGSRFHRNASHSLLVLSSLCAVAWWVADRAGLPIAPGVRWAWIAALFSHPFVDYWTTSHSIRERGFAIPLLWPLTARRYAPARTLFDSLEVEYVSGWGDFWKGIRPEFTHLAFPAAVVIAAARFF